MRKRKWDVKAIFRSWDENVPSSASHSLDTTHTPPWPHTAMTQYTLLHGPHSQDTTHTAARSHSQVATHPTVWLKFYWMKHQERLGCRRDHQKQIELWMIDVDALGFEPCLFGLIPLGDFPFKADLSHSSWQQNAQLTHSCRVGRWLEVLCRGMAFPGLSTFNPVVDIWPWGCHPSFLLLLCHSLSEQLHSLEAKLRLVMGGYRVRSCS